MPEIYPFVVFSDVIYISKKGIIHFHIGIIVNALALEDLCVILKM